MATVIDELTLNLGLDPAKFTAGQRSAIEALRQLEQQATKSGKETESQSKKLLDFFVNLKKETLSFLGAFYGGRGVADVVEHLTRMDASLSRVASISNVSQEALAKWRIAVRLMGGEASEADEAISSLNQAMFAAARNPAGNIDFIKSMGIIQQRFGIRPEEMHDPISILTAIARGAANNPIYQGQEGRSRFVSDLQGIPGLSQNMIFLLLELQKRLSEAAPLVPAGGGEGPFSKEFISATNRFEVAAENIARVVLDWFVPTIESLGKLIESFLHPEGGSQKAYGDLQDKLRSKFGTPSNPRTDLMEKWFPTVNAMFDVLFGGGWAALYRDLHKIKPATAAAPSLDTAVGFHGGIESLILPGAKGAAAVSNVHNSRSSTDQSSSTSTTNVGNIHLNFPNVTSPTGVGNAVRGAVNSPSIGASANSGQQ